MISFLCAVIITVGWYAILLQLEWFLKLYLYRVLQGEGKFKEYDL